MNFNTPRVIAIGDVHGCLIALNALIQVLNVTRGDTLVFLGDFIDKGLDTKGVIEYLIELKKKYTVVVVMGNHEEMMLGARSSYSQLRYWIDNGGGTALDSYGASEQLSLIPQSHFDFVQSCVDYYETDTHIFLHANYYPEVTLTEQKAHTLRWLSLSSYLPDKIHCSGKVAIVGHTKMSEILDLGYLVCIDTGVATGGYLTAFDVHSHRFWQVDEYGNVRMIKGDV